ncbi:MFS transporter [Rhodoligotrophos ferricapiens]|uniref:MFS transporter n=1 Tax=Rhodoligotrophos ferricapiens TaxID=3069264 RepID=UPI00315D1414
MSNVEPGAQQAAAPGAAPAPAPAPPLIRSVSCIAASVLLWTTQGFGMNLVAANVYQIQGSLGASLNETMWLLAAYTAPNASLAILLVKIRNQFGLRRFAEISIAVFAAVALLHLFVRDLPSAVAVRFVAGIAASPISSLGFLYMLDAFPAARKMTWGLSLALTCSAASPSIARLISPPLIDIGLWHGLYMLEIGLALLSLAVVYLLPLTPVPRTKVLHWLDFVSYPLIGISFGLLAVVLSLGRFYWWFEAPWLGVCLAGSIIAFALAAAIEINRESPLINLRWLMTPEILHFAIVLLVFRIVLSEQTSGAIGLFQNIGLLNEQSQTLYLVILAATILGGLTSAALLNIERVSVLHAVALACITVGAFMDAHSTNLTRPANMYMSQGLIAYGGGLFLPPAMMAGFTKTLKQGPTYITSFIMLFLATQSLGGLIGSAAFGTFVTLREKFHSNQLVENITLASPIIADRVHQLGAAHGRVLTDPILRNAEGSALLAQQATREAYILAYNDAFLLISVIAGLALAGLVITVIWSRLRLLLLPAAKAAEAS